MSEERDEEELEDESGDFSGEENLEYVPTRAQIAKLKKEDKKEEKKAKYRLSNTTMVLMVGLALATDVVELVSEWLGIGLVISPLVAIFIGMTFWFWFNLKGVNFIGSTKKFITSTVTFIAEVIPGFDAIGGFFWTIGIVIMVIIVRLEDQTGVSLNMVKAGAAAKKALRPSMATARERTLSAGSDFAKRRGVPLPRQTMETSKANMLQVASNMTKKTGRATGVVNRLDLNREKINRLASLGGRGARPYVTSDMPQVGSDISTDMSSVVKQKPSWAVDSDAITKQNVNDYFETYKKMGDSPEVAADKAWKKVSDEIKGKE